VPLFVILFQQFRCQNFTRLEKVFLVMCTVPELWWEIKNPPLAHTSIMLILEQKCKPNTVGLGLVCNLCDDYVYERVGNTFWDLNNKYKYLSTCCFSLTPQITIRTLENTFLRYTKCPALGQSPMHHKGRTETIWPIRAWLTAGHHITPDVGRSYTPAQQGTQSSVQGL
jgi:hypothetical protein